MIINLPSQKHKLRVCGISDSNKHSVCVDILKNGVMHEMWLPRAQIVKVSRINPQEVIITHTVPKRSLRSVRSGKKSPFKF